MHLTSDSRCDLSQQLFRMAVLHRLVLLALLLLAVAGPARGHQEDHEYVDDGSDDFGANVYLPPEPARDDE